MDLKEITEGEQYTEAQINEGIEAERCSIVPKEEHLLISRSLSKPMKPIAITFELDLNIVDCLPAPDQVLQKEETHTYSTESMSSFGDSDVGIEDIEVQSQFKPNLEESEMYGKSSKNKLTEHWKNFVHPIRWRSKWLELQLEDLRKQALKYDKEILEYECKKSLLAEQCNAKTLPFSDRYQKQKIMKRFKRNKCEENTDYTSYISNHNVFSYLGHDNHSTNSSNIYTNGKGYNKRKKECEDEAMWDLLDSKYEANEVENIIKVEDMLARVRSLMSRVNNLVNELADHSSISLQSLPDQSAQLSEGDLEEDLCERSATPVSCMFAMQDDSFETEHEDLIFTNNKAAEEEMNDMMNFGGLPNTSHDNLGNFGTAVKNPGQQKT